MINFFIIYSIELSIIKNHCQIELIIDDLSNQLKSRLFDRIPLSLKQNRDGLSSPVSRILDENVSDNDSDELYRVYPLRTASIPVTGFVSLSPEST
jgi:hypothetical protein